MEFTEEHISYFLNKDDPNTFFPQINRILLVRDFLQRVTVSTDDIKGNLLKGHKIGQHVGLNYLLKYNVFTAAFPLHDGDIKIDAYGQKPKSLWPLRPWLYECWARWGRWHCYQPLDQIRDYFGEKIAIYFAWLGMYTAMLFPITAFGIFCFVWGIMTMDSDEPTKNVCDKRWSATWIVCRSCQSVTCTFKSLDKSCMYAKLNAVFQHNMVVVFALVLALWAVIFLEMWKRKQATLACKWDTFDLGYEYEPPRPEYQATAKEKRRHPITREWEPYMPARSRIQNIVASLSTVTFLITLAIAVIFGAIIFKATMVIYFYKYKLPLVDLLGSATVTSLTASCMNACCIVILEKIYGVIAWWLTTKEYPRTMSNFETSYTYKMYIFQFVNYYALLFYLSFIQPSVQAGVTPITSQIFNDQCDPIGCAFFVTMQLIVILVLKQAWNNVVEIFMPKVLHWWKIRKNIEETEENIYTRYEQDFDLPEPPPLSLLPEYLEMVIQYGIVVLFGAAFPLAPLFALVNNIIEIRVDAYKFVVEVRREVPYRGSDIGSWYAIMEFVTRLGILTNALLIALTTDLIDRYVYILLFSQTGDLQGYLDFILAEFDTADWKNPALIFDPEFGNVTICRYRGYFNPPNSENPYGLANSGWVVMFAKAAFVLIFQNLVIWIQEIIQYVIPDVPEGVELHTQRNRYISRLAAYKFDKEKREKEASAFPAKQKHSEEM